MFIMLVKGGPIAAGPTAFQWVPVNDSTLYFQWMLPEKEVQLHSNK
jgi:hypothetical protein